MTYQILNKKFLIEKPDLIIFDWDNTLIDAWPIILSSLNATFKEFGLKELSLAEAQKHAHRSMREEFPRIFGKQAADAASFLQTHYKNKRFENYQALDNAENTLKLIQNYSQIICAIISNKNHISLGEEIAYLKWQEYFENFVGAGFAEYDKPHISSANKLFEILSFNPQDKKIWFIGDSMSDIKLAYNINALPILYGEFDFDIPEFYKDNLPGIWCKNHVELQNLVKEFC